jgi:hypothetical protein
MGGVRFFDLRRGRKMAQEREFGKVSRWITLLRARVSILGDLIVPSFRSINGRRSCAAPVDVDI